MRLIDADALRNALIGCQMMYAKIDTSKERFDTIGEVIGLLEQMPTIDIDKIAEAHEAIGYEKGRADGYAEAVEDENGNWNYFPNCGSKNEVDG